MSTRKLAESVRGFEQLSSSSGWRFMAKKVRAVVVKGLTLWVCSSHYIAWSSLLYGYFYCA